MKKIKTRLIVVLALTMLIASPIWAEYKVTELADKVVDEIADNKEVKEINKVGSNDGVQQLGGDLGEIVAKFGSKTVDWAFRNWKNNKNIPYETVKKYANKGTQIFFNGKVIEYGSKAAPHVGYGSSSLGRMWEGDYSGAAVVAANGAARTVTIASAAAAAAATIGATAAATIGAGATATLAVPVIVGVGAAVVVGVAWDKTVGTLANTVDKRMLPWIRQQIVRLSHTKFIDTLIELNVKSPDPYHNCLCRNAGYGSPGTSQFYHPGVIGKPDKRYSCQQARKDEPCVVAGYGCTRHPLPKDSKIVDSCMQLNRIGMKKGKDGKILMKTDKDGNVWKTDGGDPIPIGKRLDELLHEEVKRRAAQHRARLSVGEKNNLSGGVGGLVPGTEPKR